MIAPDHMYSSKVRHERTTFTSSTTTRQDMRPEITKGRGILADMRGVSEIGDRVSSSTVGVAEDRDTGL